MVSIIIPIYKAEKYIKECLASIQKQTYTHFEVLCINDGSPDCSADICQKFVVTDNRFKLINQENGGVSLARNTGLKNAQGKYVCFIDSDDIISPNYLEHLIKLSEDNSFAICSFVRDLSKLGQGSSRIKEYHASDFIKHIFNEDVEHPNICMMLFKNSIIQTQHLDFTVGCIKNEDTEFYVKYLTYENKVKVSDYKGYYYRINPTSAMNSGIDMKSLTSIEAQERMAKYLVNKGIYDADNSILSNSVQVYVWASAKSGLREIYDYLHSHYSVVTHMKKMFRHPRLERKIVSALYLILGRKCFFRTISFFVKYKYTINSKSDTP